MRLRHNIAVDRTAGSHSLAAAGHRVMITGIGRQFHLSEVT